MKKIWVCGSSGMLGSHIVNLLNQKQIPFIPSRSSEVDITKLDQVSDFVRFNKFTHIINCAAYTQVDKAESEPKDAYEVNAKGPHHLAIAARRHSVERFLHVSTDYVFPGSGHVPYDENHLCSPIGAYGMSKFAGELKVLDEFDRSCILRTSWLFGHPGNNFVEKILRLMCERETLNIVSDQIGRPTYCQDLAEAILGIINEEGVFHFANSKETSWFQFTQEIYNQAQALGFPLTIKSIQPVLTKDYPTPAKRPAYSALCTNKIEQVLGYAPRPWTEALQDYLIRLKKHQNSI
ncbi:MAG: dTDP-4-dehydrorhamnose reductase [Parachlamydiaceae bacterium]|nr:dTDP-4-dehydrorhamnose reductase [Parachlamydiaceae bacterium]